MCVSDGSKHARCCLLSIDAGSRATPPHKHSARTIASMGAGTAPRLCCERQLLTVVYSMTAGG